PAVTGKIVVDAVVPPGPPKVSVVKLPPDGSAALHAQRPLAGAARRGSAFHNVRAPQLKSRASTRCDTRRFWRGKERRAIVIELANAAGTPGIDGGPLANSIAAEALTSVLIGINRRYKVNGAGIRITGLPAAQRREMPDEQSCNFVRRSRPQSHPRGSAGACGLRPRPAAAAGPSPARPPPRRPPRAFPSDP